MATVPVGIGSRGSEDLTVTLVSGSGPWTLTVGTALDADIDRGDTIEQTLVDPEPDIEGALFLITSIAADRLTFVVADFGASEGNPPEAVAASSVRPYSTLGGAEDGMTNLGDEGALVAGDTWEAVVHDDALISEPPVTINDTALGTSGTLLITVPAGERHTGRAGTGARWTATADGAGITLTIFVNTPNQIVEHLEIVGRTTAALSVGVQVSKTKAGAGNTILRRLIVHGFDTSAATFNYGIFLNANDIDVRNCIVYSMLKAGGGGGIGIYVQSTADDARILNCTVDNCTLWGIASNAGAGVEPLVQNCASFNAGAANTEFHDQSGNGWHASSGNNCTNAASNVPGSSNQTSKTDVDQFVNLTAGSEDYHLLVGADCINNGADLSGTFTDDLDGHARITPWDIGADGVPLAATMSSVGRFVNAGVHRRVD